MKKIIFTGIAAAALSLMQSCHNEFDNDVTSIAVTSGEANFSKYVALGNSLTSGYRDGALYADGQNESYPSMIAAQMKLAGGGDFVQPMVPNNVGGFTNIPGFGGKYVLSLVDVKDAAGNVVGKELSPVPSAAAAALDKLTGGFNNMGVPGAKSFHLVADGYGSAAGNPYFMRFASSATTSVLKDAMAQKPTFFSLWIGNNDVLSYATSGGSGKDQTGNVNPATYGSNDITDPNVLAGSIKAILDGMKAAGATKGVIANVPSVENIPFFSTVPYNPLTSAVLGKTNVAAGEAKIDDINTNLYGPIKQVLTALGQGDRINLLSKTAANPLLIKDETLADFSAAITAALTPKVGAATAFALGKVFGQARQAKDSDLVLLSTKPVIGTAPDAKTYPYAQSPLNAYGITFPLEDSHILIPSEIDAIKKATAAYNTSIKSLADAYGLAFVNANLKMVDLSAASGLQWDGVKYNAKFVTGGAFSLDGVHLTGRGYGVIANEFIKAINAKYKSNLPLVNPNNYSGVKFP